MGPESQGEINSKKIEKSQLKSEKDGQKRLLLETQASKRNQGADTEKYKRHKVKDDALVSAGFKLDRAHETSYVSLRCFLLTICLNV